ncbi:MAG: DUF1998 domain-containing protein [Deltaproteobacteria bacterium]|nr:DUF1998 domain-containing protein [Deltaproteobacteria bacterium]
MQLVARQPGDRAHDRVDFDLRSRARLGLLDRDRVVGDDADRLLGPAGERRCEREEREGEGAPEHGHGYQRRARRTLGFTLDRSKLEPQPEREQARRLRQEAESQLDLLVDNRAELHSDFYPYRYFASEGFLPGYNFPRLPLSAYLPGQRRRRREPDEFLSRPRFLAISEFGPRSIIYHEGSRYVINKVILGSEADRQAERRLGERSLCTRALRCDHCGNVEPLSDADTPDLCRECGAPAGPADLNLFRMRNVTAVRRDRITSDEEERLRIGYELRTNVHFSRVDGLLRRQRAELVTPEGTLLATLIYGHAADVWRINLGWSRRENELPGFLLDTERGTWVRSQNPEDPDPDPDEPATPQQERVIPYVEDTRNVLLVDPAAQLRVEEMAALQAALKNAIQIEFHIEDRELAAEPLPTREQRRRILFYEAAEGGAGVLRRLVEDEQAIARVAARALALCHFDPETGDDRERVASERERCEAACYDCLLSYFNQPDHRIINRFDIRALLLRWTKAKLRVSVAPTSARDRYSSLLGACSSPVQREFLAYLRDRGHRLPTRAQAHVDAIDAHVDFVYAEDGEPRVAVLVDAGACSSERQEALEDAGYLVLRCHEAAEWPAQVGAFASVFGVSSVLERELAPCSNSSTTLGIRSSVDWRRPPAASWRPAPSWASR